MAKPQPSAKSAATSTLNQSMFPACAGSDSSDDDCCASDDDSGNDDDDRCNLIFNPLTFLIKMKLSFWPPKKLRKGILIKEPKWLESTVVVLKKNTKLPPPPFQKI